MRKTRKKTDSAAMEAWFSRQDAAVEKVYSRRRKKTPQVETVAPLRPEKTPLDVAIEAHNKAESVLMASSKKVERLLAAVGRMEDLAMAQFAAGRLDTRGHHVEVRDVVLCGRVRKILVVDGNYHALSQL